MSTMSLSSTMLSLAQSDVTMRVRLAGVVDMVAFEGKYHQKYKIQFELNMKKLRDNDLCKQYDVDTIMDKLCFHLLKGLSAGHVYDMRDIW